MTGPTGRRADFIESLGPLVLAHRLRRASELILDATGPFLREHGFTAPPRAVSTLLLLHERGPLGITQISLELKLTHPLIIKLTRALAEAGYVEELPDKKDRRRRLLRLTDAGQAQVTLVRRLARAIEMAFAALFEEAGTNLLDAITSFEQAMRNTPHGDRLERAWQAEQAKD